MKSRRGDTKTGIHPRPTRPNSIRGVFANRRSFNRRRATLDDTTRVNRDTSPSREWRGWHRDPSYNYHRDGGRIRAEMRITRLHWYGGGDLSQYRARNKNPVAPNDVCTFHRVLSLSFSLFYSLFFLFYFFFFRRGVPLHAMRTLHYGLFNGRFKTRKYLSAPAECARTRIGQTRLVASSSAERIYFLSREWRSFARSNINWILRGNKTI